MFSTITDVRSKAPMCIAFLAESPADDKEKLLIPATFFHLGRQLKLSEKNSDALRRKGSMTAERKEKIRQDGRDEVAIS